MKTVPLDPRWVNSEKLDLLAVYRRPRLHGITKVRLSDDQGRPLYDYVNLPIRRHQDWLGKGYSYVTLARVADLVSVGVRDPEVVKSYKPHGEPEERTFEIQTFLAHADVAEDAEFARLKALVLKLGPDAVEAVMRHSDPTFVLPETLRDMKADDGAGVSTTTASNATATTTVSTSKGGRKKKATVTA